MFLALSSRKNKKKGRCSLKWAVCVPERLKKLYLKESKSEIINQKKGRSLSTVIIVRLEEDGKIVVTWLASDFFDSFQLFVFVQVHSINRRILPFKVINGPADVNSGSRTCGQELFFLNYVSNLQKFADSAPFFVFQLPDSSLFAATSQIVSAEQQHRFIFKSDKAVVRNFPEKVKILKSS